MNCLDVAIIGAGWSGLTAATRLASSGYTVRVLEKSRGPGGRSAARRQDGFTFDHGAQYLTARSDAFDRQVRAWAAAGLLAPWRPRIEVFGKRPGNAGRTPSERWVGFGGMNAVLRRLAEGVDCSWQWRAEILERRGDRWRIASDRGDVVEARTLLVTAPPRQTADLLGRGDPLVPTLDGLTMKPAWAIMLGFDEAPDVPFEAAFVNEGPLSWIARNDVKPGRDSGPAWVGHATAAWSREHLETGPDVVASDLKAAMAALAPAFGADASLCLAHRWRYAMCEEALEGPALVDDQRALAIAGDWCAGDRIEGAWISGVAAARRLAALL